MRRTSARLAIAVAALTLTAPAIAYVCHPDPGGTRSVSLKGHVVAYRLHGSTLTVALRSTADCRVFVWQAGADRLTPSAASCGSVANARRPYYSPSAHVRVAYAGRADRPDRLRVFDAAERVQHTWALPVRVRPGTLQVSGHLAAYAARGGNGLWVTGLRSGKTTFVAPVRAGDRPLLNAAGIAYQDNVYKHAPAGKTLMKFLPARGLQHELARVNRPLHTGGRIRSFSVDATRVALAVAGDKGCDRIVFWNIPWRSVEQVSQKAGATCASVGSSGRISDVALAGGRAAWTTVVRSRPMLVAADGIGCQEWVIRRLSGLGRHISLAGIAGDHRTLAFALVNRAGASPVTAVGRVTGGYRGRNLVRLRRSVQAVSADGWRIATLGANGSVDVSTYSGFRLRTLATSRATSLALRRNLLAVTTSNGRLDVYGIPTGRRLHSWLLPAGASHVDLHYGIAVVTAGRSVYAVDVATGRTARLALAPAKVRAQIESIGVVYAYSVGRRGTAKVIPMTRVEHALR
jgi:hypothetical protein